MGKGQSKERFTFNIGRRKEREGPEGECFMVNATQPSDEGISMCISREDLDKISACNVDQPLQVLLPSNDNNLEGKEICDVQQKVDGIYSTPGVTLNRKDTKDDAASFIKLIVNDFDCQGNSTEKNVETFVKLIHSKVGDRADKCGMCGNKSINIKLVIAQDSESTASQNVKDFTSPAKELPSKKKKKISSFRLKQCFNKTKLENGSNRLEKDAINEKLKIDAASHKHLSHSLNSSPMCFKYRDNEDKLNASLPVQFNKLSAHDDSNPTEIPFDIRDSKIPAEVTRQYLNDLVMKSFQENNYYPRSRNHSRARNRNTYGLECKDRRNHYLDLAGVEHCANNSHHNKTDDQLNSEIHLKTEKQRNTPQRSHSYNAYDSQIQYKKLHNHKKTTKHCEVEASQLPELSEPKVRHISKKQMCASKHIREHSTVNQLSPITNPKIFSNESQYSNFSPDLAYKYKNRHCKHSSSHRTNRVDPVKHFQPIYESIETRGSVQWGTYGDVEDCCVENKYNTCLPTVINSNEVPQYDSKIYDSRNHAIKHSNYNFDPSRKCDQNITCLQEHNGNEHQIKGQTNCCSDRNRQNDCNKGHEKKNYITGKCLPEHLHCVQHVIHHHYHHYDLV